ncbi:glutamate-5-semialdehyde dehydrogenase [Desulfobaculum bizertense]|uniref:Gamma-glutamyl phosphate reductase n=1 Tax=Desulfobaculum bizertense DSM 18034 TaxID=1121442 RepID=A0A1T4VLQ1_9BACT|nr:glutamate-5-semialdehyde dehydrogenase [Desulfobaculum bizertense]SKA65501.1 glutamate-5-semialdehyde dehydrogenase [Desulfobaculum bizertense DSM 18034]
MDIQEMMLSVGQRAKLASRSMAKASTAQKNAVLIRLAELLDSRRDEIAAANARDLDAAEKEGLDAPRMDRLRLTPAVIDAMALACREVAAQDDPVGEISGMHKRPNGILVGRMRIPLGVIAMIFESRPNVTVDSGILCLKAGNAVILRGGREAFHSNQYLATLLHEALTDNSLPADAVQVIETTERAAVPALCKLDQYIDVMIPRGGEGLIRAVVAEATMPVLKHYKGVVHAYVDEAADLDRAVKIVLNAKAQRPGVCNALECLLVHKAVAEQLLPRVAEALSAAGVSFRACPRALPFLGASAQPAAENDWGMEFHDLILAVKVVDSMDEALDHIAEHGSNHTEIIISQDHDTAMRFMREADASMVAINASSRFNDGGQLGLGAEIGISTSKLHAYGPMGVTELTGAKFVVFGEGQVRE